MGKFRISYSWLLMAAILAVGAMFMHPLPAQGLQPDGYAVEASIGRTISTPQSLRGQFTLRIEAATNGTINVTRGGTALVDGATIETDDQLTIAAVPTDPNYELASLTVNGTPFTSGFTYTVAGDVTIAATFSRIQYRYVSCTIQGSGAVGLYRTSSNPQQALNPNDALYSGEEVLVEITPAANCYLKQGSFRSEGLQPIDESHYRVTGNVTLAAVFEEFLPLTIQSGANGITDFNWIDEKGTLRSERLRAASRTINIPQNATASVSAVPELSYYPQITLNATKSLYPDDVFTVTGSTTIQVNYEKGVAYSVTSIEVEGSGQLYLWCFYCKPDGSKDYRQIELNGTVYGGEYLYLASPGDAGSILNATTLVTKGLKRIKDPLVQVVGDVTLKGAFAQSYLLRVELDAGAAQGRVTLAYKDRFGENFVQELTKAGQAFSIKFAKGSEVTVTARPNNHYYGTLSINQGAGSKLTAQKIKVDADCELLVSFAESKKYKYVSHQVTGEGKLRLLRGEGLGEEEIPQGGTVYEDELLRIDPVPDPGGYLKAETLKHEGLTEATGGYYRVTGDIHLSATFASTVPCTIVVGDHGAVDLGWVDNKGVSRTALVRNSTKTVDVKIGTEVTVTPHADAKYICMYSARGATAEKIYTPRSTTIEQATALEASFIQIPHKFADRSATGNGYMALVRNEGGVDEEIALHDVIYEGELLRIVSRPAADSYYIRGSLQYEGLLAMPDNIYRVERDVTLAGAFGLLMPVDLSCGPNGKCKIQWTDVNGAPQETTIADGNLRVLLIPGTALRVEPLPDNTYHALLAVNGGTPTIVYTAQDFTINEQTAIAVTFEVGKFTYLACNVSGEGEIALLRLADQPPSELEPGATIYQGEQLRIEPRPEVGHYFRVETLRTENLDLASDGTYWVTGDVKIEGEFAEAMALTVTSAPHGRTLLTWHDGFGTEQKQEVRDQSTTLYLPPATMVDVQALPDDGYQGQIAVDGTPTPDPMKTTITMDAHKAITVDFERISYTYAQLQIVGHGTLRLERPHPDTPEEVPLNGKVYEGEKLQISIQPAVGSYYIEGSLVVEGLVQEPDGLYRVTGPISLTARFADMVPITITVDPNGWAFITRCDTRGVRLKDSVRGESRVCYIMPDTLVTVTTTPDLFYQCHAITIDGETPLEPGVPFRAQKPTAINVQFERIAYIYSKLMVRGEGTVTMTRRVKETEVAVKPLDTLYAGEDVLLTFKAAEGFVFRERTLQVEGATLQSNGLYRIFGNVTIKADFEPIPIDDLPTPVEQPVVTPLSMHPNPASRWVRIQADDPALPVQLFSLDGRKLLESRSAQPEWLDVSALAPGVYIVRCGYQIGKLVICH